MNRQIVLKHEFVEFIPNELKDGTVYVSVAYATVAHKCCCGCGHEVVTPLSPTDWRLIFDGESISLEPSIGNWSFACQSHYWIKHDRVRWAPRWSKEQIAAGRAHDAAAKRLRYESDAIPAQEESPRERPLKKAKPGFWQRVKGWWGG